MTDELKEKLKRIAQLTQHEVGRSEENVKQKIAVRLLECFGHDRNQLDFEYGTRGKRIDIFIKGLPIDCKVITDTKRYDEDLSNHLEQVGLYAFTEGAILALLINGEEIRIYDPFFRGFSFKDSLLYSLKRKDLTNDVTMEILYSLLWRENLKSRRVKDFIIKREQEIIEAYSKIEEIKGRFEKRKTELSEEKEELIKKLDEIQVDIRSITEQVTKIDSGKYDEINEVLKSVGLPYIRTAPQEISPADVQRRRTRHVVSKYADRIEIIINRIHTPKKWGLIPLPREYRSFFPGYKIPFILETNIGEITTKVTSGPKGTKIGDPEAGNYIQGRLKPWYHQHTELKEGSKLIIQVIEPKRKYALTIP